MRNVVNGQAARRTDKSWIVWMVRSMLAVGVVLRRRSLRRRLQLGCACPLCSWEIDHDRFLVALQIHFLMTRGQHVVSECHFSEAMTRFSRKVPR